MTCLPEKGQWQRWSLPSKYTAIGLALTILSLFLAIVFWAISERTTIQELVAGPEEPPKLSIRFQATETKVKDIKNILKTEPLETGSLLWLGVGNTSDRYPITDLLLETTLPCCVIHSFIETKGGCSNIILENDLTSFDEAIKYRTNFFRLSADRMAPSSWLVIGLCVDNDCSSYINNNDKPKRACTNDLSNVFARMWDAIDNKQAWITYSYSWNAGKGVKRDYQVHKINIVCCEPLELAIDGGKNYSQEHYIRHIDKIPARTLTKKVTHAVDRDANQSDPTISTSRRTQAMWYMIDGKKTNSVESIDEEEPMK